MPTILPYTNILVSKLPPSDEDEIVVHNQSL